MYYQAEIEPFEFKQIFSNIDQKNDPIIVRFDINSPVKNNGRLSTYNGNVNLRLEHNGYILRAYSKLGPLILMGHQGRKNPPGTKPDKNFVNLLDHHQILSQISGIRIHFVEATSDDTWEEYSTDIIKHLKKLEQGEILLMDNVRQWDFEKQFDPQTCPYITFFEEIGISAFINDALPVWHRDDASIMFGRYIAPTYIGHISMRELRVQHKIIQDDEKKAIIIGGKKPKFEAISKLAEKMDIFTAGITGLLTTKLKGNEIGQRNEELLALCFNGKEREIKKYQEIIEEYDIQHPIDFVVSQPENLSQANRFNVPINDLKKPTFQEYEVHDIGIQTVKKYAHILNTSGYYWRIRAGPNGVFEEGFDNGIKLIENILGTGFVALGGDTVEELQKYEICKPIMYSDGAILLGGGSHLDGFAGKAYPCIQDLVKNACVKFTKS